VISDLIENFSVSLIYDRGGADLGGITGGN